MYIVILDRLRKAIQLEEAGAAVSHLRELDGPVRETIGEWA